MGLSSALQWWDEWQLRVLVLGSLVVQCLLLITAFLRKLAIPSWFRSLIWLAYLGSDALAIYSLATLFNRQRKQDCSSAHSNSVLEVVWAPVLLMHLGGQDPITAYNIEDNELWMRHVLTSVSQITVAIYVFCKSWPGGDKRLLQAAILFFVPGVLKCLEKPWALKSASINSLVSSSDPALRMANRKGKNNSLENYVPEARALVKDDDHPEAQGDEAQGDESQGEAQGKGDALDHDPEAQGDEAQGDESQGEEAQGKGDALDHDPEAQGDEAQGDESQGEEAQGKGDGLDHDPYKLFVDLASPYLNRLSILKSFWELDEKKAYRWLQEDLSNTFDLLYTKTKMFSLTESKHKRQTNPRKEFCGTCIRVLCMFLPFAAIGLFHHSHREAYNDDDVKVTYALFCCTAVVEVYSIAAGGRIRSMFVRTPESTLSAVVETYAIAVGRHIRNMVARTPESTLSGPASFGRILESIFPGSAMVAQYSLIGFFARNKKHSKKMCIVSLFKCKDYLDQHWCMKSCSSSRRITVLVLRHVKAGWKKYIVNISSYRRFNDHRGQWTLQRHQCDQDQDLGWSLKLPFDESVLLWHIATDFCFYCMEASLDHTCATAKRGKHSGDECPPRCKRQGSAIRCREMSNYMMYLLFVNPEMLMAGARRNLFTTAYHELEKILEGKEPPLEERGLTQAIFDNVKPQQDPQDPQGGLTQATLANVKSQQDPQEEGFMQDARTLAGQLLDLGDEKKMWKVIEGVWVEMLCFSAGRCRGYLHAKSLGTGGELLTYVWLVLSHMGMETLAERLQRVEAEHPSGGGNAGAAPSSSRVSTTGEDIV